MRPKMATLAMVFLVSTANVAAAGTVCNIYGLGAELTEFHINSCDGTLDFNEAIDCVNRLAKEKEAQRQRASAALAQAECLCDALNKVVGGFGRYNRLNGSCSVDR